MTTANVEIFRNGLLPRILVEDNKDESIKRERMLLFYTFLGNYHSINTIKSYKQDLALFFKTLHGSFPKLHEYRVEEEHSIYVVNQLKGKGLSDRRIARLISCLSAFYTFLVRKKKISASPFQYVDLPRISRDVLTQALDFEDYVKILRYSEEICLTNPRIAIMLKLYFTIGYRNNEVAAIKREDLEFSGEKVFIKFKVKGNKIQKILIEPLLSRFIINFINIEKFSDDEYIFAVKDRSKAPSPSNVWDIFQRLKKKIGIKCDKFTPHAARATVITYLLRTESIQNVSRFVTHGSIEMTARYDKNRLMNEQSVAYQEYLNNLVN